MQSLMTSSFVHRIVLLENVEATAARYGRLMRRRNSLAVPHTPPDFKDVGCSGYDRMYAAESLSVKKCQPLASA